MAIRNLEIRKQGQGYTIFEQAGSNSRQDRPVHESPNREDAAAWLTGQGAPADAVEQALATAATAPQAFVELPEGYAEAENFPKR